MLLLKFSAWYVRACKHGEKNWLKWSVEHIIFTCQHSYFSLSYLGLISKIAQYILILGF